MITIIITTDSIEDAETIKDLLEAASADGMIEEPFELEQQEV